VARLERFAKDAGFEPWYLPRRGEASHPMFRRLIAGNAAERERFFTETFLDLRPTTDDRPFFFSYYRWRHLFEHRDDIDQGHTLATGQIVLVVIFGVSCLFSVVAIGLPLLRVRAAAAGTAGRAGLLAYFAAHGVGFIFVEITFVQMFIRFLGYPTYSLTVTLCAFLVSAGGGALASGRLPDEPRRVLPPLALALTTIVVAYTFVLPAIFDRLLTAPLPARVLVTGLLCAPLGAVLGTFFPYGIRLVSARDRDFVAWAWAVNGCLTVLGSVASIILAMTYGFSTVVFVAVGVYWLGVASFVRAYARGAAAAPNVDALRPSAA
jgi:hypothetical protein